MYADSNENPRTMGETYAVAAGASSMKMEPHKFSSADVIAAAGMNQHRMGLSILRLVSEWQSGAVPKPAKAPTEKELRKAGVSADLADAEARRMAAECSDWHMQENMLRFQRLKTLGTVRAGLLHYARDRGWENAETLVADVLRFFLSPKCPHCLGRGNMVIPGSNRAVGRECRKCRGTGEVDLSHGGRGRSLFGYLKSCAGHAASDLREGAYKLRRPEQSDKDRQAHREGEGAAKVKRAASEAHADSLQDSEAVAERFRRGLELGRKAESN